MTICFEIAFEIEPPRRGGARIFAENCPADLCVHCASAVKKINGKLVRMLYLLFLSSFPCKSTTCNASCSIKFT